jgi:uracil phosphoribosyltransferase
MSIPGRYFPSLRIVGHPLVQDRLTLLRDRHTSMRAFRRALHEATLLMGYEAARDLTLTSRPIETPLRAMRSPVLEEDSVAIVAILRAGLAMAEAMAELLPSAPIGHVGVYRDPATKRPVDYYLKLPSASGRHFIVVDPMLATGGSALSAVGALNRHGVPDERIRFLCLLAAPEGLAAFAAVHPGVPVLAASLDEGLDAHAYIVPGLGDAGDRLFGTD